MKLSIVVITNKPKLNGLFLTSLHFGDELIVDKKEQLQTESFAERRNSALKKAKGEWVLFIDDDEVVSRELAREITEVIKTSKNQGYYLNRKDLFYNQVIRFGEVSNISILRLAQKGSGLFARDVHEVWNIKGKTAKLTNELYHIKDNFISEFVARISLYGPLDADSLNKEGKSFTFFKLLFYPKAKFIQNYIFRRGHLDGFVGLFLAYLMSVQSLSVRIFQWEKQRS
ncbi:MAG: lipopolysaccharide core biosynthesis glycosyltransferase WaaE [uncultured bacterium]|nr:MAG: lipopolysaccharide core biosynthesis glycosyltransferase WaaE [uncultured bacterium]